MKKLLGYKWKTPQTRKENVNNVLDIIGLGPNQDRMYCSLSTEVKGVCVTPPLLVHVLFNLFQKYIQNT
jgi:hypothetical protein